MLKSELGESKQRLAKQLNPKYSGWYLRLELEYYENGELGKAIVYLYRCAT